jgi:cell division protein FtsB
MAPGRGSTTRAAGPRVGSGRPARRATTARPGGRPGATAHGRMRGLSTTAIRPRLTSRAAVLVLVLAALLVSYASSLRAYVDQRHHISSVRASIAQSQRDIDALEREKKRWRDPAYVISQARARFAFGFPGEIGYQVLDADGQPLDHEDSLSAPRSLPESEPEWWQTTLTSIETAGNPPKDTPEPAAKITAPPAATPEP